MKEEKAKVILKFSFSNDDIDKKLTVPNDVVHKLTPLAKVAKDAAKTSAYGGPIHPKNIIIGRETMSRVIAHACHHACKDHLKHLTVDPDGLYSVIEAIVDGFKSDKEKDIAKSAEKFHDFMNDFGNTMLVQGVGIANEMKDLFPNIVDDDMIDELNEMTDNEGDNDNVIYVMQDGPMHQDVSKEDAREYLRMLKFYKEAWAKKQEILYGDSDED